MGSDDQVHKPIQIEGVTFDLSDKSGALVIYCPKHFRGASIGVVAETVWNKYEAWANVVEKSINEQQMFIAVFPKLKPMQYQALSQLRAPRVVTIFANNIAEIDWR